MNNKCRPGRLEKRGVLDGISISVKRGESMYRILVVDDEEKIRGLIRKYAEFEGNQVTEAQNGMEAVELCRKYPNAFDIIIMDVMMPELDGFPLWRRSARPARHPC